MKKANPMLIKGTLGKILGEKWKAMSDEEKAVSIAQTNARIHAMGEWRKQSHFFFFYFLTN